MGNPVPKRGGPRYSWRNALPISVMVSFFASVIGTLVGPTTKKDIFWCVEVAATSTVGAFLSWAVYRLATERDDGLSFFVTVILAPLVRSSNRDPGPISVWAIQAAYCWVLMVCCLAVTRFKPEWWDELILDVEREDLPRTVSAFNDLEFDQMPR